MSKITLTDLADLQNEASAVNAINANNTAIANAMEKTLSRDGTSPNQMASNLDMNSNQILNLPTPTSNFEPLRVIDRTTLNGGGSITVSSLPTGGTVNQLLTKNSSTNYDASWRTPAAATGTLPTGGAINQVLTKSSNSDYVTTWNTPHPLTAGGTRGQILAKNSSTDYDSSWVERNVVTPEMFGATTGTSGTAATAVQAAVNYLASLSGGVIEFGPYIYRFNSTVTISTPGITLKGASSNTGNGTEIYFAPPSVGAVAIDITAGAGIVSNICIRDMGFRAPDTTIYKTAIRVSDSSFCVLNNIHVWSWTGGTSTAITGAVANGSGEIRLTVAGASVSYLDGAAVMVKGVGGTVEANQAWPIIISGGNTIDLKGSTFTNAYTAGGTITLTSTGIQLRGREFQLWDNVTISADLPMRISVNPNYATNSLDQSNFNNTTLVTSLTANDCNSIVLVDEATVLTSVSFTGVQSWGGGKNGLTWYSKTSPAINEQILIANVRAEQKTIAGGWNFDIRPNTAIYSLTFDNPLVSDRNGIRARNVQNLSIFSPHFIGATSCLDIDSTVLMTSIDGCWSQPGTTSTLSGQNILYAAYSSTGGGLPTFAQYASTSLTAGPNTAGNGVVTGVGANATGAVAPFFWINSCAGAPTGVPNPTFTGRMPLTFDSTNNKLYVYNGSWKGVTVS